MKRAVVIFFMIMVLHGCTKPQVKDSSKGASPVDQPVAATILSTDSEDRGFADCVQRELKNRISGLEFVPEDRFRDALFPWFEPSTAPTEIGQLASIMKKTLVRDRIQSLGIRFVIFVGGFTSKEEFKGPFMVTGGYGAAGALGYTSSDRKTAISAVVWDIKKMASLGDIQVEKTGSFKWIGVILPIPIPDTTKSSACTETAKGISDCIPAKGSLKDQSDR